MLTARCLSVLIICFSSLTISLLSSPLALAVPPAEQEAKDAPTCELILRGHEIKTLVLESFVPHPTEPGLMLDTKSNKPHKFSSPKGIIKLPPGHYEIKQLTLPNELEAQFGYPLEKFELTPEKPYEIIIENFSCEVTAERIGPFLNFNFKGPFDSQGRKYIGAWDGGVEGLTPVYSVSCQGKEIASDTLEYG